MTNLETVDIYKVYMYVKIFLEFLPMGEFVGDEQIFGLTDEYQNLFQSVWIILFAIVLEQYFYSSTF